MAEVLSVALRPRTFEQVVGAKSTITAIRKQVETRMPNAWMFAGPSGTGKTTLARIIAVSLQCNHAPFGSPCEACWNMREQFAIREVNVALNNGVEEIGNIARDSVFIPTPPSTARVVILDEAHMLTYNAQNLLLKYFEEPRQTTHWMICTTEPRKVIATLKGRCMVYTTRTMDASMREIFLKKMATRAGIKKDLSPLIDAIQEADVAAPRNLLMALEKYASGVRAKDAVLDDGGGAFDSYALCRAVAQGNWNDAKDVMAAGQPDAARYLRASLAGYLRGMLVRSSASAPASSISWSLNRILAPAPLEDALLWSWLWSAVYDICAKLRR